MKIQLTRAHKQMQDKAVKRVKWMGATMLLFASATYIATSLSESMDSYVQFVDAQEDLLITQMPQADIDETGKIATEDFYAWYQLDELDTLDAEYASVRKFLDSTIELEENVDVTDQQAAPGTSCAEAGQKWNQQDFKCKTRFNGANGYVEEYWDEQQCMSYIVIPGLQLMPTGFLACVYFVFLMFLFVGISIIADLFMEAIETITSTTQRVEIYDRDGINKFFVERPVWNATIANLSLMALGSSAPEILLSVVDTCGKLGQPAGALGPSTIVGSAAFNLLFISAVCIPSVDEPKKIADMGVFITTAIFSLFAYLWLFICLQVWTPGQVTRLEGWLTLSFFFLLLSLAFIADKYNQSKVKKEEEAQEDKDEEDKLDKSAKKARLRLLAKAYGDQVVIEVAQGLANEQTDMVQDKEQREIIDLYQQILETQEIQKVSVGILDQVLQPEALLERFAARKANAISANRDFLEIKGVKGQIERDDIQVTTRNEMIAFKCLHYSVTESSPYVEVTVVKRCKGQEFEFGIRTVEDTAKEGSEFEQMNKVVQMKKNEDEKSFQISVIDNNNWQPDMEFFVELYDPSGTVGMPKFYGDDTKTKVTILDEDFPGTICFEDTQLTVSQKEAKLEIKILRLDGSDGQISCNIRTQPCQDTTDLDVKQAQEYIDYEPMSERVEFKQGENEKTVTIKLGNGTIDGVKVGETKDGGDGDEDEEKQDMMFRVILENPDPQIVKLSRKNVAFITIDHSERAANEQYEQAKLIEFFMSQKKPTWSAQFKNAVMLGPTIDEEGTDVDNVTLYEAIMHFMCISWKVLFAIVPPTHWGGGWPAFLVALTFIGAVTAIVGEVATLLGCVCGIPDSVTAITLVALGTSLPDTFASMTAAKSSVSADSAIGNVTGSNSVNVFLGLGLPWVIASSYALAQDPSGPASTDADYDFTKDPNVYVTPPGDLAFSVIVFLSVSLCGFAILLTRRYVIGGELGGPKTSAYASAALLVSLWLIYIILSIIKSLSNLKVEEIGSVAPVSSPEYF